MAQALEAAHPKRARGSILAGVDRLDAGSIDLGHVGRVHQGERRHAEPQLVRLGIDEAEPWDTEPDQKDDHHAGDRPEDVGVDRREDPQGEEDRSRKAAQHRDEQTKDQDEDLGDHEELDVDHECPDDAGQGIREDPPVEERLLDGRPAGCVDDDPAEDTENDDRRGEGDDRGAQRPPSLEATAGVDGAHERRTRVDYGWKSGTLSWNGRNSLARRSRVPSSVSVANAPLTQSVSGLSLARTALKCSGVPPAN